jgi:glycosyltransferase involved in cell wall biosynthesis
VIAPARAALPRIAITGPMLGRNPGYVTTQGEFLTDLLRESGYDVVSTSVLPGRFRRLADTIRTLHRELPRTDLVIVETYSGPSFVVEDIVSRLVRGHARPLVLHLHGGGMPEFAKRFPRWSARVLRRAAALVSPSEFLAREMRAAAGPVRVIPNILDLDTYPHRRRERVAPRLLWMRAYHEIYNPVMALRVLARVRAQLPEATLVMAGPDKGMRETVLASARALGLDGAVEILGFLDERAKREVAARCDVFLNTTNVDNAPVAVVEMGAFGLPVVTTDVGGIRDLLADGESGLFVHAGDDERMSDAVVRLVREPALAALLSAAGQRLAAQWAGPSVLSQWEALFAELLGRSPETR